MVVLSLSLKRKQSTSSSWLGKNFDEANCKDIKREREKFLQESEELIN
jgi:hypothetical protein